MYISSFMQILFDQEIRYHVARQIESGGLVRTSDVIDAIRRAYPRTNVTDRQLENMVIEAASWAGVPVEMGRSAQAA